MLRTSWEPERESAPAQEIRERLLRALAPPGPPADTGTAAARPPAGAAAPAEGQPAGEAGWRHAPAAGTRREPGADSPAVVDAAAGTHPPAEPVGGGDPDGRGAVWGADPFPDAGVGDAAAALHHQDPWDAAAIVPSRRRDAVFGAFDPGRRGVRALLVVAVVALAGAALFAWYARPRLEPVRTASADRPTAAASPSRAEVVVAVSGRVRHPGLLHLPIGSRVADAVEAAGGVLPGTDLAQLNLARRLTDGELVVVGAPAAGAAAPGGGLVDLNTATVEELDRLPGVGPTLAQRIVDFRTEHGGFRAVDQLREVDGIGPSKFAEIKDRVTV